MIKEIERLLEEYQDWLKEKIRLRQIDDAWVEISTPYLDRYNDWMQLYVKRTDGGYLITDDGYTIRDLEQSGCNLETPKRQSLLQMTLNGFGVKRKREALEVYATEDNFSVRKHNILQAMLAVNDLFFLATPLVESLFYEDVVLWLDYHQIRYTPRVKFAGKSGYDHMFDFIVPKSPDAPERILNTISQPSRNTAQKMAFSWLDTKEDRPKDSKAYAVLNDLEANITAAVIDALINYDVQPVAWSEREKLIRELAA